MTARLRTSALSALLLLAAAAGNSPLARGATDQPAAFNAARTAFEAARAGSHVEVDHAHELFSRLVDAEPGNPLYLAYFGSSYTLQARESRLPWTKIKLVNQGVELLDRSLASLHGGASQASQAGSTISLETRLIAIATFIALPDSMFHHMDAARRELQAALTSPEFTHASADLQGHLLYEGALIAQADHDDRAERAALLKVQALAPPSVDAAVVRQRLAELH